MPENYKKALTEAKAELIRLVAEKDKLDSRIQRLRQTILSLGDLCNEKPQEIELWVKRNASGRPTGITDAIRWVLQGAEKPLEYTEIRDELRRRGFDLSRYQNVMASIHTIITRLILKGEVDPLNEGGFRWRVKGKGKLPAFFNKEEKKGGGPYAPATNLPAVSVAD